MRNIYSHPSKSSNAAFLFCNGCTHHYHCIGADLSDEADTTHYPVPAGRGHRRDRSADRRQIVRTPRKTGVY